MQAKTVAIGTAVALVLTGCSNSSGHLKATGAGYQFCYQPPTPADWKAQVAHGLVFGLDAFTLAPPVTVTKVDMTKPSGGITVTKLFFVPGAEVGDGTLGDQEVTTQDPGLFKQAQYLPAKLTKTASNYWQLVVIVTTPLTTSRATTGPFRITYRSGSATKVAVGADTVVVGTAPNACAARQS